MTAVKEWVKERLTSGKSFVQLLKRKMVTNQASYLSNHLDKYIR